jgi:hypothetical protein
VRKLQNFGPRSYRFTAAAPVFHARAGMTDLTRMRYRIGRDQLTCRRGAPKTRHQFGCPARERGI